MSLNCQDTTVHVIKLQTATDTGSMSVHNDKLQMDDTTHVAFRGSTNGASPDDTMYGAFGSTNGTSILELDPLSSMDSTQTHHSPITPKSPRTYLPSPCDSITSLKITC